MEKTEYISKYLPVRADTALRRAGIITVQHFLDAIQNYGLRSLSEGVFYFGADGPSLMNAGRKTWEIYIAFLDDIGFDWKEYVIPSHVYQPESRMEYDVNIRDKINKLINLLDEYKEKFGDDRD